MGTIIIETKQIPALHRNKKLHIYLPNGYDFKNTSYPVLYMHDGHNLFDIETSAFNASWNVHYALDEIEKQTALNMIVVGIDSPSDQRFDEYSPWINNNMKEYISYLKAPSYGGEGEIYLQWIVSELKPWIDANFRTIVNKTFMAGSSMGGLISIYAGCRFPNVFLAVGAFSPAIWFAETEFLNYVKNNGSSIKSVYLDVGTNETSDPACDSFPKIYLLGARKLYEILLNNKIEHLIYFEDEGGTHSEKAWEQRFPRFARWLLQL
ncbi:MAG: alpha/beta hydrolase-fold protein [Candidatus Izemoplasmatales bacterium]|jgi:predicted alpha/beta superfamily hydrolase|nr:alpha/beta hydrolase-fold protein [Candidatus Izemoplasmatales bacterium]